MDADKPRHGHAQRTGFAQQQNMMTRIQSDYALQSCKRLSDKKYRKVCKKMACWREAKERKRLLNPVERKPVMERYFPLEWAVRDKRNGDIVWMDLRSV